MLLWLVAIFFLSSQPKSDIPSFGFWDTLIKKGSHFLAYAMLAFLVQRVTSGGKRPYSLAFLITVLYAISDEYHQTFVPGRNGTVMDVLIDSLGGLTALVSLRMNWLRWPARSHQSDPLP